MAKKKLEALMVLMSILGCSKQQDIRNNEYSIREDENLKRNFDYMSSLTSKITETKQLISESEKKRIVKEYLKPRIRNCYYNVKGWTKNRMDDLTRCVWGS